MKYEQLETVVVEHCSSIFSITTRVKAVRKEHNEERLVLEE